MDRDFYHDVAMEIMSLVNVRGLRTKSFLKGQFSIFDEANYYEAGTVEVTTTGIECRCGLGTFMVWFLADMDKPTFFEDVAEAICQLVR